MADRDDARGGGASTTAGVGDRKVETRELQRRTKHLEQENEILRRATAHFNRECAPKMMPR